MKYNNEEDEFLIKNYENKGLSWCSKELNRTKYSIKNRAKILKLKVDRRVANSNFTKEDIDFLCNNYSTMGTEIISVKLNKSKRQIRRKINELKLRVNKDYISEIHRKVTQNYWNNFEKPFNKFKVNPENFMKPSTPEVSYILGILWADGFIKNSGKGKENSVGIENLTDDVLDIKWIFDKTGIIFYWKL